jgi:hypothetical protein
VPQLARISRPSQRSDPTAGTLNPTNLRAFFIISSHLIFIAFSISAEMDRWKRPGAWNNSPGYPSAARFFAHAARDAGEDNRSLPSPVCVLEVLGVTPGGSRRLLRLHAIAKRTLHT